MSSFVKAIYRNRRVLREDSELLQTYARALRNTKRQTSRPRAIIWRLECLRASGVVRAKPLWLVLFNAEPISEYVDVYFLVDTLQRGAEIQQHQSWHEACVSRSYDNVANADDGGLCRVVLSVGWLAHRKTTVLLGVSSHTLYYQPLELRFEIGR